MRHICLGNLPRTRNWQRVIQLVREGVSTGEVARATLLVSKQELSDVSQDVDLVHTVWLLTQLESASRQSGFTPNLRQVGLFVSDNPALHEILACFSDAVDRELRLTGGRTNIGEMAQFSAIASITKLCASQLDSLFETTTHDVNWSLRRFSTTRGFARLSRDFFSRMLFRYLSYFLSRELSNHTGGNRRFFNLQEYTEFLKALEVRGTAPEEGEK